MTTSPLADLRGLPYYDEPTLYMNRRPALGLGVRRLEAREHVLEERLLHPRWLSNTQTIFRGPDRVDPADCGARLRTPFELRWDRAVKFDHDFIGRGALEREAANPRRRVVTLVWDAEDVVDIYASLLQPGEEDKTIDLPTSPPWTEGVNVHADHVLRNGRPIGVSSGTIYNLTEGRNDEVDAAALAAAP